MKSGSWDQLYHSWEERGTRITDLETALLAATDLAKRQCAELKELKAERDARPVARWVKIHEGREELMYGPVRVGMAIRSPVSRGNAPWFVGIGYSLAGETVYATPEAAKAAVEEALREVQNGP